MQAGEEYGRTKFGDGNSYRSDPKLNMMRWHQTVEFADLLSYYEGLISLRKNCPVCMTRVQMQTDALPIKRYGLKAWFPIVRTTLQMQQLTMYTANCLLYTTATKRRFLWNFPKATGLFWQTKMRLTAAKILY